MNEILNKLNALRADDLERVIASAGILLEKKRKEEAEEALREKERQRQERIAQEKKRQAEILELKRRIDELQKQSETAQSVREEIRGDQFVMYEPAAPAPKPVQPAPAPAPVQPAPVQPTPKPAQVACPRCRQLNSAGSIYCAACGQKITAPQPVQPKPAQITCPHCSQLNNADSIYCAGCGQKMTKPTPPKKPAQAAPAPDPSQVVCPHCRMRNSAGSAFCFYCGQRLTKPADAPQSTPQSAPQSAGGVSQVVYANEAAKTWDLLPGERVEQYKNLLHECRFIIPDMGRKDLFFMRVTNQRLLFYRQNALSHNMRVGMGGLVGEMVMEATGGGPKPYMAIPLSAVTGCGLQNRNEFYLTADKTYVLKNKGYEKFLPALVEQAKANRR